MEWNEFIRLNNDVAYYGLVKSLARCLKLYIAIETALCMHTIDQISKEKWNKKQKQNREKQQYVRS